MIIEKALTKNWSRPTTYREPDNAENRKVERQDIRSIPSRAAEHSNPKLQRSPPLPGKGFYEPDESTAAMQLKKKSGTVLKHLYFGSNSR